MNNYELYLTIVKSIIVPVQAPIELSIKIHNRIKDVLTETVLLIGCEIKEQIGQNKEVVMRSIRHFSRSGISVGIDFNDGTVRVALSSVHSGEPFSRKAANHVLNLRFDGEQSILNAFNIRRSLIKFNYNGQNQHRDVSKPISSFIRDYLEKRRKPHVQSMLTSLSNFINNVLVPSFKVDRVEA